MIEFTYNEHSNSFSRIQQITLNNVETEFTGDDYFSRLHSLIKIFCFNYGFEPGIDTTMLKQQIVSFSKKSLGKSICIIIDETGLFLKDLFSAEKYINSALNSSSNKIYPTFGD